MNQIRVAIDASATPEHLTGAGYYATELVSQLDANAEVELSIITRINDKKRFSHIAPKSHIIAAAPNNVARRIIFQTFQLGSIVDSLNVDVFHGPHYQLPRSMKTPSVVTIHDMTLVTHPEVHTRAKRLFFGRAIPSSIRKANAVISVSEHTAADIKKTYSTTPEIVVAPLGVDQTRFHARNPESSAEDRKLLESRGITSPYIGFLGLLEPRKCVPTLIEAFASIASIFPEHRLVIAGGDGWGIHEIREAKAKSGVASRVVLPGRLNDDEVSAFLRQADVFVYPSMYEGFGMPVIEAMACGAAVITTESSSLSEVAGNAAVLVQPRNADELARAIEDVLSDKQKQKSMSQSGIERAREFTWQRCAEQHIRAYEAALRNANG